MFAQRYRLKLNLTRQNGLHRDPPLIEKRQGKYLLSGGRRLINFAGNDYLGLGASERLRRKVAANFEKYGSSASSSRLSSGNFQVLNEAEKVYADYFGYADALFYPSGFQANLGLLATLFEPGDAVVFDKHIHASSVKGLTLSGADLFGFAHNRTGHLEKRLQTIRRQAAVVTESLFSMDGDCLDRGAYLSLKQKYDFFCIVDEAHALGVLGPGGKGIAGGLADAAVGTLGKSFGLFGAFILLPAGIKDYLLNFCVPQIYTTTLPEAHAASALDALDIIAGYDAQRYALAHMSHWMKAGLQRAGFAVDGDAHIMTVHIGEEQAARDIARTLFQRGYCVLAARYPTVALGKAILRLSLTAEHTQEDVSGFINALKEAYGP